MAAPLTLSRKLLFAALLAGTTLGLLIGGLELALRIAGVGHSAQFFRRASLPDGTVVWRENRWCTAPYFGTALVRRPQPVRLLAEKPPGTARLFVLGSSAAMGDPEASFSLARMLESMLRAAYPEQRIEVVNAAITAINSHLVRDIAADCTALEPDLFIVYEGHNEVIGPYGPAGVFAPFLRSETALTATRAIQRTRTAQWLATLRQPAGPPADWGGMQMFLQQEIPADDPRLDAVRTRFAANLRAIAAEAHRAGAATLLCTVLTNQRDFPPFLSRHRPGLTPTQLAEWQQAFDLAQKLEQAGDLPGAESAYRSAYALDPAHAETAWRFGRLALTAGRALDARDLLQRALDLDPLRFRTDSRLNQSIRDLSREALPGVTVVDLAATLAAHSPHGIPGDELLYEHVHLTFRGTYESARELFPSVSAELARRGIIRVAAPVPFELDEARIRLGYNAHEQTMIALELRNRFSRAPFSGQAGADARLQAWDRRILQAGQLLGRPDATPTLLEISRRSLAFAPDDWIIARNTGAMLVSRDLPREALPHLQRAARWIDDDIDTLLALGHAHKALGHAPEATTAFAHARQIEPRHPSLPTTAGPDRPAK